MPAPHFGAVVFALARALVCRAVALAGVDQGLQDAQTIFEGTLEDLAPKLREMPE